LPGARDLWAVSVHFKAAADGVETRTKQAEELTRAIRAEIPEGDLLVVGGDLNTEDAAEPCLGALAAVVDVAPPYPADAKGNTATNAPRRVAYDWVLADADLRKLEIPVRIGSAAFPSGLVFDTRVMDLPPARPDDSAAEAMQHMAVVRDFLVK
jgi:hypothetical protein